MYAGSRTLGDKALHREKVLMAEIEGRKTIMKRTQQIAAIMHR
jgi:hypothetical protein